VAAFTLSFFASISCLFVYRPTASPVDFGFFSFYNGPDSQINDSLYCVKWDRPRDDFDMWFNAAKTFSAIAATIGGVTLLGVFATFCCSCGPILAYWGTWGMVACFFSQGFTMLVFVSQECGGKCTLGTDGIFSAVAIVLWFLGAVVVSQLPVFLTDENMY
jgi:hypothetical protein